MAHHIYTTDAYILSSELSGEADRFYTLFTRDLGLVRASARGVRLGKSKLRYSLQDFSRSKISLVRGKEIWRITSARLEDDIFRKYRGSKPVLHLIAHIAVLIKRLVTGEEKNSELFAIVDNVVAFLEKKEYSTKELKYIEIASVLRILNNLGYLRHIEEFSSILRDEWSDEMLHMLESNKVQALKEINTSLQETHL